MLKYYKNNPSVTLRIRTTRIPHLGSQQK